MNKIDRFWSHDASNIRCVREADFDAVCAELAALKAERLSAGGAYSSDPLACSGCAAGCFRCRSSAGVVVGALVSALEGIVHDERVPNEVSQDYAALLIEARRLNHCRAQAVPDEWREVIQKTLRNYRMGTLSDGEGGGYPLIDAMSADGQTVAGGIEECEYLAEAIWCALNEAAAPSTNSEQARACVTCNGVGIIGHSTLCPECAAAPSTQRKESGDE